MKRISRLGAALGALAIAVAALLGVVVADSSAADKTVVTIIYNAGSFTPSPVSVPNRAYIRFTNNSGLQLQVRSNGGAGAICGFNITVDGFATSQDLGPLIKGGRCNYSGSTALSGSRGAIDVAPPPGGNPTPTPTPTKSPTGKPTSKPTTTPKPSGSPRPSKSPSVSPSAEPTESEEPLPEPTITVSPEPLPSQAAPSSSPAPVFVVDLRNQGRRSAGLPGALAAIALAAVIGAIARVLSAEAAAGAR